MDVETKYAYINFVCKVYLCVLHDDQEANTT